MLVYVFSLNLMNIGLTVQQSDFFCGGREGIKNGSMYLDGVFIKVFFPCMVAFDLHINPVRNVSQLSLLSCA